MKKKHSKIEQLDGTQEDKREPPLDDSDVESDSEKDESDRNETIITFKTIQEQMEKVIKESFNDFYKNSEWPILGFMSL